MKILGLVSKIGGWFNKSENTKTLVDGVEVVGKFRLSKRKISVVLIAILSILLFFGKIDIETFIELFKEIE